LGDDALVEVLKLPFRMATDEQKAEFWRTLLLAVEVEPRSATSIRGASGFSHPIVSVGIDEARRRVVIISGESDARSAALAHGDIQAAMPSLKVMMARPIAVNLGAAAQTLSELLGRVSLGQQDLEWLSKNMKPENHEEIGKQIGLRLAKHGWAMIEPWSIASLNPLAVWKEIVQQLSFVELEIVTKQENEAQGGATPQKQLPTIRFPKLVGLDPAEVDRILGVCSVPLYGFSSGDVGIFHSGRDIEAARGVLRRHGILQYFFPSADQLALGLSEQLSSTPAEIVERLARTPEVGHPFGELEIIEPGVRLIDTISALQEFGLLVEGEAGVEITETGKTMRAQVRFKPREGLLTRLANILSVKVDLSLKDLFKQ
jgi:hypothetical protein